MNILIGNLNKMTTVSQLSTLFLQFGIVRSATIIVDKLTGYSLGYGYIEMDNQPGLSAISELNTIRFMNFYIDVSEYPR